MILEQVIFERAGGALALADGRATAELAIAGDVPTLLARLGVMKPLVVSGGGLARSGVAEEMARRGMPLVHFDGFAPNPTAEQVQAGLAMFRAEGCDGILSIGGGSAMDVAKGIKALGETDAHASLLERLTHPAPGASRRISRRSTSAGRNILSPTKRCCRKRRSSIRKNCQRCLMRSAQRRFSMRSATASKATGRAARRRRAAITLRRRSAFWRRMRRLICVATRRQRAR